MADKGKTMSAELIALADHYPQPEHGWTCFHCGDTFKTYGSARDHFGFDPSSDPACRIKVGAERGLVMALRKAEKANAEITALLHNESSEGYRIAASQGSRHHEQIMAAEESGYERGFIEGARKDADRIAALEANLAARDRFIVNAGLWDDFVTRVDEIARQLREEQGNG